jgi:hypothetical protein
MRKLLIVLALISGVVAPPAAPAASVSIAPSVDIGLPFWCDWGYDPYERCYRDDGPRLPVGGVDDKVWRSAFRFSLTAIPKGAVIESATLRLFHDGTCVAPRLESIACDGRPYGLAAHPILDSDWYRDQEPVVDGFPAAEAWLDDSAVSDFVVFDLTALVRGWHRGTIRNDGLVVKLNDDEENFDTGGPYFASSSFATPSVRPILRVRYAPPT